MTFCFDLFVFSCILQISFFLLVFFILVMPNVFSTDKCDFVSSLLLSFMRTLDFGV